MSTGILTMDRQRGMALIVSLIILLSLTLLGLAAIQNSTLEERMAGNARGANIALQAAEAALREGEAWLANLKDQPVAANNTNVWIFDGPDPNLANGLAWWEEPANASFWTAGTLPAGVREVSFDLKFTDADKLPVRPRYVIEDAGLVQDSPVIGQELVGRTLYRITARAVDSGGRGQVILQSTYARRF